MTMQSVYALGWAGAVVLGHRRRKQDSRADYAVCIAGMPIYLGRAELCQPAGMVLVAELGVEIAYFEAALLRMRLDVRASLRILVVCLLVFLMATV